MSADTSQHLCQFFALTLRVQNDPGRIEYVTCAPLRTQKKQKQQQTKKASDPGRHKKKSERSIYVDHPLTTPTK